MDGAATGGGGGNDKGKEKEEWERVEELEMKVLREVDVGLAVPGRVYRGPGLGRESMG
jgi:hypothetical protein